MATWRTPEQRLAELDRKRAKLAAQKRTAATREKIVVGAAVVAEMRENPEFFARVIAILRERVKRDSDLRAIAEILESDPAQNKATLPGTAESEVSIPPTSPHEETPSTETDPFADLDGTRRRQNRFS